jgi:hypothetical protein
MSLQYGRNVSLIVASPSGQGVDLGKFRIVFEVKRGDKQTPNSCDVKVYNLSQSTANSLRANKNGVPEFTQLTLKVSYGTQPPQQIFWGSITQVRIGREDQKNSYVAFTAADGDESYNFAPTAFTLAAGSTPLSPIQTIIGDMARFAYGGPTKQSTDGQPITQGYIPPSLQHSTQRTLRGRTYFGDCQAELRSIAEQNDCWHSVQDGQLTFIPKTGYIPEPPVLITPATGLIGVPEQSQNGLKIRVLLNPTIKIGRVIKLQSSDVNQLRYGLDQGSVASNLFLLQGGATKLNADGLFYVMRAEHSGDTRGTPWYTDLTCLAVDVSQVPASVTASTTISKVIFRY